MLSSRDKLLAGLFAVQLAAAAAFGAVLVNGLHHDTTGTATLAAAGTTGGLTAGAAGGVAAGAPVTAAGPTSSPVAGAGAIPTVTAVPGTATGPRTVTTVVGGSAGSAGTETSGTSSGSSKKAKTGGGTTAASAAPKASGAAGAGASEIAPGAPIKIGSIVTESGAINFNSSAQGTKAYIDMVNAAGGVDGHKIQLIQDDDQLSPQTGDAEFQSLAAQGIFAYGAFQAPQTEGSLKSLLDGEGIPLIGSYGEYEEYHDPLAFAFTTQYVHYGYEMGAYLKKLGVTKPALLYVDNDDPNANSEITNGFQAGFGAAPTYTGKKQPTDTYQNDVLTMRRDGVDGLASILDTGSYERFLQAAGSYATTLKHVADPLFNVADIKKLSNSDGTYVASDLEYVDSSNPKVTAYINAVTAEFGSNATIDYIGEVGWLDGEIIVDTLKSMHGVYTKKGLISAVENLGTYSSGLTQPLPFAPGLRDINKCIQFGKLTGGKVVPTQGYTCDNQPA